MRSPIAASLVVLALDLAACSGTSAQIENNSVTGSVEGKKLTPSDAIAVLAQAKFNGNNVALARVGLFDHTDICSRAMQGQESPNLKGLVLEVRHEDLAKMPPAIVPGTYTLGAELKDQYFEYVVARFAATDGACQNTVAKGSGASGRITIDAIDATHIAGSYSVRFDSGDALNGTFNAPLCNVPIPTETSCAK